MRRVVRLHGIDGRPRIVLPAPEWILIREMAGVARTTSRQEPGAAARISTFLAAPPGLRLGLGLAVGVLTCGAATGLLFAELARGLEPLTFGLQIRCSTS